MKIHMNNTLGVVMNQNVTTVQGLAFASVGLVIDPTEATTWAAIISALAGVFMLFLTLWKTVIDVRMKKKSEFKLDLDTRKAELELKRLMEDEEKEDGFI